MRKIMSSSPTNFYEMYGASEIGTATVVKLDGNSPSSTVGKAVDDCRIYIQEDTKNNQDLNDKTRKIGEICVQSPYPFSRYLGIKSIPTTIVNNASFFKTGDLGWLDENNNLYFAGRKDDRVTIGGVSVYLNDIYMEIKTLDYIIDHVVVGIHDDYFGTVPAVAMVVNHQNENINKFDEKKIQQKILAYLARKLSPYQLPRKIKFYSSLPLLSSGKINRQLIISELQENKGVKSKITLLTYCFHQLIFHTLG